MGKDIDHLRKGRVGDFFRVTLVDSEYDSNVVYFEGIVSISRGNDGYDDYHNFSVLRVDLFNSDGYTHKNPYVAGDYVSVRADDVADCDYIDKTHVLYNDCQELKSVFDDMHRNAPWQVEGRVYSNTPTYPEYDKHHDYPHFDVIKEQTWNLSDAKSIKDCEKWLLENHPDYYMGCVVKQCCPSGSFMIMPAPCGEYPEGMFETIENRRKYAAMMSCSYGVDLGPAEFSDKSNRRLPDVDISDESIDIEDTFE